MTKTLIGLPPVTMPSTVNPYAMHPGECRHVYKEQSIYEQANELRSRWLLRNWTGTKQASHSLAPTACIVHRF